MRILGIDPGTAVCGFGLIESPTSNRYICVDYGTIRSKAKQAQAERLKNIYDGVAGIIAAFQPDLMAVEDVFYGHNVQAALKLGQARGAVILAGVNAGIPVTAYAARQVKQSLTGYGAASKEQVQRMVRELLGLSQAVSPLDASDALAIALCHAQRWWTDQKLKSIKSK
ncbi:crossover junction endodeoxyribonuclease RuvC [candidate division KSB1 bacterium]|nr:crossover junction endodeoxyribonuclease RuvC [candidate division KSB1 bacterium]RQW07512.1 MAG: crossover junction endodeoxyribonuclease RuvC [candidate division KSB1 bacterium]